MPSPDRILIGRIGPPHGVRGEVFLHSFAAVAEDIATYGPLSNAAGTARYTVAGLKVAGDRLVARLEGVSDRTAAEKLRGTELYVARPNLPPPEEGEWYHADLIGLAVVDAAGIAWGTIRAVENYGASDLLDILATDGEAVLVPFTDDYVPAVDLASRRATVLRPTTTGEDERERE